MVYPKLPEPTPLWPTPLMETADYEVLDIVIKNAEDSCLLCFNHTAENSNPIMFCDKCKSGVHARCYGEGHIEDIDKRWTCRPCRWNLQQTKSGRKKELLAGDYQCFICGLKSGLLKGFVKDVYNLKHDRHVKT